MFNTDFDRILYLLLPVWMRGAKMLAILKAMVKPVKTILTNLQNYRIGVFETLTHTGQVMYLEHLLNQKFYPQATVNVRIYIEDSDDLRNDDILYNTGEGITPIYMTDRKSVV